MPNRFSIDDSAYENMLDLLNSAAGIERAGCLKDITFINDEYWLQDTAVIENIEYHYGEWNIFLVFAHHQLATKFIRRKIARYSSYKKACLAGHYMRRLAAKDQRGTLTVQPNLMRLTFN